MTDWTFRCDCRTTDAPKLWTQTETNWTVTVRFNGGLLQVANRRNKALSIASQYRTNAADQNMRDKDCSPCTTGSYGRPYAADGLALSILQ